MAKFTYLLGAGVSAYALPIVSKMRDRMKSISELVETFDFKNESFSSADKIQESISSAQKLFVQNLRWLAETGNDQTIDGLARTYYEKEDIEKFRRLKATLSAYILCEQTIQDDEFSRLDKRYHEFVHIACQKQPNRHSLRPDIKVLSWNYDMQIEKAISGLWPDIDFSLLFDDLRVYPGKTQINDNKVSLVKLNGTAGFHTLHQVS